MGTTVRVASIESKVTLVTIAALEVVGLAVDSMRLSTASGRKRTIGKRKDAKAFPLNCLKHSFFAADEIA
jgi:hypothetical protein